MTTIPLGQDTVLSQIASGAVSLIVRLDRSVTTFLKRRNAINALYKLDDRALSDIGVFRCHIEAAVQGKKAKDF